VAERLLARGIDLWFAEYRVLPENYEEFEEALDDGIHRATHGLVFTNQRWSEAEWCRYEMQGLINRIGDSANIVEVCIPKEEGPHVEYPLLAANEPVVFRGHHVRPESEDVEELVGEICARLGLPDPHQSTSVQRGERVSFQRYGAEFDPGPLRHSGSRTFLAQVVDTVGYYRSANFIGSIAGIEVSLDFYVWPFDSALRNLSISQEHAANDREVYTAYRRYAQQWIEGESERRSSKLCSQGLHLVFIGRHSHFGLTYISKELSRTEAVWERRYSITLKDQGTKLLGEVGLIFAAILKGSRQQQFEQIYLLGPQLDAIAQSFRQRRQTISEKIVNSLALFASRGIYAAIAIASLFYFSADSGSVLGEIALAIAIGYLIVDILLLAFRPLYKRLLWTMYPLADELSYRSTYERLSAGLYHELISVPIALVTDLIFLPRCLFRTPLRILATAVVGTLAYSIWLYVFRNQDLPILATLVPAGPLIGAALKLISVEDWISTKRKQ
jgi:hypothetical protein